MLISLFTKQKTGNQLKFQRYSAPANRARTIMDILCCETPDFYDSVELMASYKYNPQD